MGDILGKMAKNCVKITKPKFWGGGGGAKGGGGGGGKTVGDMGGTSQFSGSGVIPPPTRVNPAREEIVGVTVE